MGVSHNLINKQHVHLCVSIVRIFMTLQDCHMQKYGSSIHVE